MEQNYLNTIRDVLDNGTWQKNERTGELCCALDGAMTRFDISQAFTAAVTTKKLAWKSITGEFCAFLRGATSAADFRALGSKVWDQNANENTQWLANPFRLGEDHLGDVYGAQWRRWPGYKFFEGYPSGEVIKKIEADGWVYRGQVGENMSRDADEFKSEGYLWTKEIDQLGDCIRKLILNPSDRRILFHGWNPAKLDEIALPACHLLYQFLPNLTRGELNLTIYIRSWDTFLGGPFNIAEGGLLLELVSRLTGFKPKRVTIFSGDTHVYKKHLGVVEEQLNRIPLNAPQLDIDDRVPYFHAMLNRFKEEHAIKSGGYQDATEFDVAAREHVVEEAVGWLSKVEPTDFTLDGYIHHPELKAQMAV